MKIARDRVGQPQILYTRGTGEAQSKAQVLGCKNAMGLKELSLEHTEYRVTAWYTRRDAASRVLK
jgi:hypothetical protein